MIYKMIIIFWTVFFDSLRDGHLHDPSWLKQHIFKWLAFYPIILYLIWNYDINLMSITVIFCTIFFDRLRDEFLKENWITRHIFKWFAFYPIIIYLIWGWNWYWFVVMAILSWLIWQFGIRVICKKNWESWWIKLIEQIFKKK